LERLGPATWLTRKVQCAPEQYIDIPLPAKDTETITKWYDALSRSYDELYGEEQDRKHVRVLQVIGKREFNMIVDVGCGTGKLLELIAPRSKLALGIDLSVEMLRKGKQGKTSLGIQWIRADASHLPLQDRIVDGVTSVSMTESGRVLDEHFSEISRIASENALMVMTIFGEKDRTSWRQAKERGIELVATLSSREQLYLLDRANHRVRASPESSALV